MSWNLKSQQSFEASETLIKHELYGNSIHCSYYSILQILYQIISEELGMSEEDINNGIVYDNSTSHKWVINKATKLMRGLPIKKIQVKNINTEINKLKENRVLADYSETIADEGLAIESLRKSEEVKKELSNLFNL